MCIRDRYKWLDRLNAYKVRPAADEPPGKWETGTQSYESLSGVTAAVDYLADLGGAEGTRRERLARGLAAIKAYEAELSEHFLRGAMRVPGLRVYGITDVESLARRTPTFAIELAGHTPEDVAAWLGERGFFVWHGHYYAIAVMERLGMLDRGGLVRVGFVHYNTVEESDRLIAALGELAG